MKNISLGPQGSISSRHNRETKCKASLFLHHLPAHFRVSPPFGTSRRAAHTPNGQLVSKCSLNTYCGPRTGCHSLPPWRRGQKKLFKGMHSAARRPKFKPWLYHTLPWPRAGYFYHPCFSFLIYKWEYYSICHMCLWKWNGVCKALEQWSAPVNSQYDYQCH